MPIVFSLELDMSTIEAGDTEVILRSDAKGSVDCVTLFPAIECLPSAPIGPNRGI